MYGSSGALEGDNITDDLEAQGIRLAKLHTVQDFSGTVGGRIIRNKLWFFGGARHEKVERDILDAFDPDGTPITNVKRGEYFFGKGSYQASSSNRLTGFYHWTTDYELRNATRFVPRESMEEKDNPVSITKGEWQTVRGNALVASVQYGRWNYKGPGYSSAPGKVSTTDIATLFVTGDNFSINGRDQDDHRDHTKAVISYYKPDLLRGNHEFKLGVDHLFNSFNDGYGPIGPNNSLGYQLRFNNGVPFQLATRNTPAKGLNYSNYFGVYGQDAWTLARRVTLNLGIRFERESAYAPDQCREAAAFATAQCFDEFHLKTFNSIAPRAHIAFDVVGDGKTVIKGGYGRFNALRELQPDLTSINLNGPATTTWDWHDNNGNKLYEAGEVNLDPNGRDFRSVTGIGGNVLGVVNPNEKQPKTDEFSATLERELIANTAVRVTGVYTRNFNNYGLSEISREGQYTIPITNRDPGPDGAAGTGDDGGLVTYYEYPASLGQPNVREDDVRQQRRLGPEFQVLRSRVHETSLAGMAAWRVVLDHLDGPPDSVQPIGHRVGQQQFSLDLVSQPVQHQSQPVLQHGRQHAAVAVQGVGRVQPAVGHSGVGQLRCPERAATGSASGLYRGPDHPIPSVERGADRQLQPPEHPRAGHPSGEARRSREPLTLGGAAGGHLQCAEQGHDQVLEPGVGAKLSASGHDHVPADCAARRHVELLSSVSDCPWARRLRWRASLFPPRAKASRL